MALQVSLEQKVLIFFRELSLRKNMAAIIFIVVCLVFLALGFVWPKKYSSSTTIFVDSTNIIQPLLEGSAVSTEVGDMARIASEMIFSRKIMKEIIVRGGWDIDSLSSIDVEKIIEKIQMNTKVKNLSSRLIEISYTDSDPVRAFDITRSMVELFIVESSRSKKGESKAAYNFIDKQVKVYHAQLLKSEEKLKEYKSQMFDGSATSVDRRISDLQGQIQTATLELNRSRLQEKSIVRQLTTEAAITKSLARETAYKQRIVEYENRLDELRVVYNDSYPDIVTLLTQIDELKAKIREEALIRMKTKTEPAVSTGEFYVDEENTVGSVYQSLRNELSQTQLKIESLESSIDAWQKLLEQEKSRVQRIHQNEAALAELTRDYDVNHEIYQDMLKRREQARLSMHLDLEGQGQSFKVQEPARLPVKPDGLRFLYFVIAGPVLGIMIPVGLVVLMVQFDARIKDPLVLQDITGLPVLAVIPPSKGSIMERAVRPGVFRMLTALMLVAVAYAVVIYMKIMGVL